MPKASQERCLGRLLKKAKVTSSNLVRGSITCGTCVRRRRLAPFAHAVNNAASYLVYSKKRGYASQHPQRDVRDDCLHYAVTVIVAELDSLVPWKTKLPVTVTVNVPDVVVEIVSWDEAVLTQSHATKVGLMVAGTDGLEVVALTSPSFAHPLRALTLTAMVWEEPAGATADDE